MQRILKGNNMVLQTAVLLIKKWKDKKLDQIIEKLHQAGVHYKTLNIMVNN